MNNLLGSLYLKELEAEAPATRKCLERIPENLFDYKPHERSMIMGYLALIVAEVPKWVADMVIKSEVDIGRENYFQPKNHAELVKYFDDNMNEARKALENISDEALAENFNLTNKGEVLFTSRKDENISSTINHWVHHRGQLTVYMRLNNIPVPSIYGPSADDKGF